MINKGTNNLQNNQKLDRIIKISSNKRNIQQKNLSIRINTNLKQQVSQKRQQDDQNNQNDYFENKILQNNSQMSSEKNTNDGSNSLNKDKKKQVNQKQDYKQESQDLLQQIQEENIRLQEQVNQNGQIITSLIETLKKENSGEEMVDIIKQAQKNLESKKVFKKTFRINNQVKSEISNNEDEDSIQNSIIQKRLYAPQTVGNNRPNNQLCRPRILKTSNFQQNPKNLKKGQSNSVNSLFTDFNDINTFSTVKDNDFKRTIKFYEENQQQEEPQTPHLNQPSKIQNQKLKLPINYMQKDKSQQISQQQYFQQQQQQNSQEIRKSQQLILNPDSQVINKKSQLPMINSNSQQINKKSQLPIIYLDNIKKQKSNQQFKNTKVHNLSENQVLNTSQNLDAIGNMTFQLSTKKINKLSVFEFQNEQNKHKKNEQLDNNVKESLISVDRNSKTFQSKDSLQFQIKQIKSNKNIDYLQLSNKISGKLKIPNSQEGSVTGFQLEKFKESKPTQQYKFPKDVFTNKKDVFTNRNPFKQSQD